MDDISHSSSELRKTYTLPKIKIAWVLLIDLCFLGDLQNFLPWLCLVIGQRTMFLVYPASSKLSNSVTV